MIANDENLSWMLNTSGEVASSLCETKRVVERESLRSFVLILTAQLIAHIYFHMTKQHTSW